MDRHEIGHGLKLAVIAVASAALTATLVIGVGNAVIQREPAPSAAPAYLVQVADR